MRDEAATVQLGRQLAQVLADVPGAVLFLEGELGAGKTCLARAVLHGLGVEGPVRSPSYTLVEPYELGERRLLHIDLYRIAGAEEIEQLGLGDFPPQETLWLVEWPSRGAAHLPPPDLALRLWPERSGRAAQLQARSSLGEAVLSQLEAAADRS